ncbi:hmg-box variant [Moniliophthora roreri]|uniref:DUF1014-domain-containing protein n=1 Tax=Moniliophthora roreri TaxID=221103 RepID=A0A0W0FFF6_MONRR|nr:hmg-box variant [Moniliophthora roreri]
MRHPILTNISPIFYSSTTTYHSKVELEDSAIMAPKGGNAKKEAGRAKKAENEAKKAEAVAAERERKEAAEWIDPMSKSSKSKAEKEEKRKADLARKAENARLLDEEEKGSAAKARNPGAKKKAAEKPAGPGALAAGGGLDAVSTKDEKPGTEAPKEVESYAATGIDNMLDLLEVVNAKTDKASVGAQAAGIERHPERRFKAAFEAYSERELPQLRKDYPGLRLQQYKDLLYKQFQKSEENPFNQTTVAYNASKDEKVSALKDRQKGIEERLRED